MKETIRSVKKEAKKKAQNVQQLTGDLTLTATIWIGVSPSEIKTTLQRYADRGEMTQSAVESIYNAFLINMRPVVVTNTVPLNDSVSVPDEINTVANMMPQAMADYLIKNLYLVRVIMQKTTCDI